ncbi:MAG TPA: hypothetical protein VKC53_00015 [Patescibacteria group bacterium]|nr:hypothetical protein [Patescibacteria group bacterium]
MKAKFESPISLDVLVLIISLIVTFILWRVSITFPPDTTPIYIFIIGISASFLLFGMVFALTRAERKTVEADIEHSRLLSAIESIPFGLVITDLNENIILSNHGLSQVLIEAGATWTLKKLDEVLGADFPTIDSYKKVIAERRGLAWKRVVYSGKKLDIYMAPIFSEKEGILGVLILIRDIA